MMIWMYLFLLLLGADTCDTWDTWAQDGDKRRYAAGEGEGGTFPIQEVYHRHGWARREYFFKNLKSRNRIVLWIGRWMNFILFHFQYFKNKFQFFLVDTIYHKGPIGSAEMKRGISMFNNIGGSTLYLNLLHLFNRESGRDCLHQNKILFSLLIRQFGFS